MAAAALTDSQDTERSSAVHVADGERSAAADFPGTMSALEPLDRMELCGSLLTWVRGRAPAVLGRVWRMERWLAAGGEAVSTALAGC